MNKIFKVIWSKSKQCYIVVSEMAKNHSGKKKIVVASILAAMAVGSETAVVEVQAGAFDGGQIGSYYATAIGYKANAFTDSSIAIGTYSYSKGTQVPGDAGSTVDPSIAIGNKARAVGNSALAVGMNATADNSFGVAVGRNTEVTGDYGVGIGFKSKAALHGIGIGEQARALKEGATTLGVSSRGYGKGAIAIGWQSLAGADVYTAGVPGNDINKDSSSKIDGYNNWGDMSVGLRALATGGNATALGRNAAATAANAVAIGGGNGNSFNDNTERTQASGVKSTAIGYNSTASGTSAATLGTKASASAENAAAIGTSASASAKDTFAAGSSAAATAEGATAVGKAAKAQKADATAVGSGATASEANAVAIGKDAEASKGNAIAIGKEAEATEASATAIGDGANAEKANAVAIGKGAISGGTSGVAVGNDAQAQAADTIAVGSSSRASSANDSAFGNAAQATGGASTAIGYTVNASGNQSFGAGSNTSVSGTAAVGIGYKVTASGDRSISIGNNNGDTTTSATGSYTVAIGSGTTAGGSGAVAIGKNVQNTKDYTTAIGLNLTASESATASVLLGYNSTTQGNQSVNIGSTNTTEKAAQYSTAIGYKAKVGGKNAIAIGSNPDTGNELIASATNSVAIGTSAQAKAEGATALGYGAGATSSNSLAFGTSASSSAEKAVALGNSATSTANSAVAIGDSAQSKANHSVAIGTNAKVLAGQGSVALGWGTEIGEDDVRLTNKVADAQKTYAYLLDKSAEDAANDAGNGIVAIGKKRSSGDGQTIARRLTGVAGGVNDYDAVNLKQVKALESNERHIKAKTGNDAYTPDATGKITLNYVNGKGQDVTGEVAEIKDVAKKSDEWMLRTQNGTATADATPQTISGLSKKAVTLKAGDNIAIENSNGTVTIKAKDVVTSITSGNNTALTVSPSNGAVTITPNIASAVGANDEDGKLVTSGVVKTALDAKIDKTAEMHIKTGEYTVGADGTASLIQQNGNNQDLSTRVTIKDIAKKSVVDGINTTVNTHTTQISDLTSAVGGKVSQSEFDTFKAKAITFTGDDNAGVARALDTTLTVKGGANYTSTTANTNIRVEKDGSTGAAGLLVKLSDKLTGMKEIAGDGKTDLVIKNGTNTVTITPGKTGDNGTVNFGDAKVVASNLEADITYRANGVADTAANTVKLKKGLNFTAATDTNTTTDGPKSGLSITTGADGLVTFGLDKATRSKVDNAADKNLSNLSDDGKGKVTELAKAAAKEAVKVAPGINTTVDTDTTTTTGVTTYKVNANDTTVAVTGDGLSISGGDLGATNRVRAYTLDLSAATKGKLTAVGNLAGVIGGTTIAADGTVTGPTFNITKAEGGTETANTLKDAIDKLNATNAGQNTKISETAGKVGTLETNVTNLGNTVTKLGNTVTSNYNDLSNKITQAGTNVTTTLTTKGLDFTGNDTTAKVHRDLGTALTIQGAENFTRAATETNNIKVVKNNDALDVKLAENLGNIKEIAGDGTHDLVIKNGDTKVTVKAPKDGNAGSIDFGDTKLVASNLDASIKYRVNDDAVGNAKSVKLADGFNYVASKDVTTTAEGPKSGLVIKAEDNGKVTFGLDKATREKVDNAADKNLSNLSDDGKDKVKELAKTAAQDAVKVAPGINTTVDTDTTTNAGVTTYKVNANDTTVAVSGTELTIDGGTPDTTTKIRAYTLGLSDATKGKLAAVGNLATVIGGTTIAADGSVTGPTFTITKADGNTETAKTLKDAIEKLDAANAGQNTAITNLGARIDNLVDGGMTFIGDDATADKVTRKLGETLNIHGQNNITVKKDGTDATTLNVKLASELKNITSITNADGDGKPGSKITLGTDGVSIANTAAGQDGAAGETKTVTIGKDGINAGSMKITNVAEATANGDATNKQYVDTAISNAINNANTSIGNKGLDFYGNKDSADTDKIHRNLGEALKVKGAENFTREATATNNIDVVKNATGDGLDVKLAENLGNIKEIAGDGTHDLVIKNGDTKITVEAAKDGNKGVVDLGDTKLKVSDLDATISYKAGTETVKNKVKLQDGFNFVAGTGTVAPKHLEAGTTSPTANTDSTEPKKGIAISTAANGVVNIGLDSDTRGAIDNAANKDLSNLTQTGKDQVTTLAKTAAKEVVKVANGINTTVDTDTTTTEGVTVYKVNAIDTTVAVGSDALTINNATPDTNKVRAYSVDLSDATKGKLAAVGNLATVIGGTTIAADGSVTGPTFTITKADGNTETAKTLKDAIEKLDAANAGQNTAITNLGTRINNLVDGGMTFIGDDVTADKVTRKLGETLNIHGQNNISVKKEANSKDTLNVTLASELKNITSITNAEADGKPGSKITLGADGVSIANTVAGQDGAAGETKTVTIGKDGINAGSMKITNVAEATADGDAANKQYVDTAISNLKDTVTKNANLRYAGDTNEGADADKTYLNLPLATDTLKVAGTAGEIKTVAKAGTITLSLEKAVTDKLAQLGDTTSNGRDGANGLTGADGQNGKTVSEKVNALRNGEAGTVVYTDDAGERLVKANDGKYYHKDDLKADGTPKTADENNGTAPKAVDNPQARVVNANGDTKTATTLSNIADGKVVAGSKEAVNGGQLHAVKSDLATALGGDSKVNADGSFTGPTYNITKDDGSNTTEEAKSVGDAISKLDTRINNANTNLGNKGLDFYGNKDAADTDKVHRNLGEALKVKGAENFTREATATNNIDVVKNAAGDGLDVKLAENLGNIKEIAGDGTHDLVIKNGDTKVTVKAPKDGNTGSIDFGDTKLVANNLEADITYRANSASDAEAKSVKLQKGLNFVASDVATTTEDGPKSGLVIKAEDDGKVTFGLDKATREKVDNAADKNLSNLSEAGNNKITNLAKAAAKETVKVANGINTTVDTDTTTTEGVTTYKVNANDTKVAIAGDGLTISGGDLGATDRVRTYTLDLSDATKGKLVAVGNLANVIGGTTIAADGTVTGPTFNITKADGTGENANTLKEAIEKLDAANQGQNEKITNLGNSITEKGLDFYGNKDSADTDKVHRNLGEALKVKGAENFTREATATNNIDVVKNAAGDGLDVKLAENLGSIKEIAGDGKTDLVIKNGDATITLKPAKPAVNDPATGDETTPAKPSTVDFGDSNVVAKNLDASITYRANNDTDENAKSVKLKQGLNFVAGTGTVAPKHLEAGTPSPSANTDSVATKKGIVISTEDNGVVNIGLDSDTRSAIDNSANQDLSNVTTAGKQAITDAAQGAVKVAAGNNVTIDTETKDNVTTYTVNGRDTTVKAATGGSVSVTGGNLNAKGEREYTVDLTDATKAEINRIAGIDTRLTTAEGNITTLQGDMTKAKADIAGNTQAINTNKQEIAKNAQNIAKNAGDIATNAGNIKTNATNIATNAGNIATNTANITKNAGDIATNAGNIKTNANNIMTNAAAIAKNAGDIKNLQGNSATKDLSNLTNAGKDVVTGLVNVVGTNGITVTSDTDTTSRVKTFTAKLDDKVTFGKEGNKITIDGTTGTITAPNAKINAVNTNTVQVGDANKTNTVVTPEGVTVTTKQPDGTVTSTVMIKDGTVSGLTNTKWDPTKVTDADRSKAATQGQVKDVSDTLQKGRVFAADTGVASTTVVLGDTLMIKGGAKGPMTDNNIGVELSAGTDKTPATMTVRLAKDVKMKDGSTSYNYYLPEVITKPDGTKDIAKNADGTVKYQTDKEGNPISIVTTTVNGEGITITPVKGLNKPSVSVTADGLDNGGNAIHHVAPGTAADDAATLGQVVAAASAVSRQVNQTGAHAAALAAMNPLSYDPLKKSQVMAGYGAYKGNSALALGVAHYANEDTLFNVGVSVGNGENMVNAGMTYRFGGEDSMIPERYKGGPISSVYVMQDEITALKAENARKDAENAKKEAENEEMKAQIKMLIERVTMLEAKK